MSKLAKREEISNEFKWSLEDLVQSPQQWKENFNEIDRLSKDIESYRGLLGNSSQSLLECLQKKDDLLQKLDTLAVYSHMHLHEDTAKGSSQADVEKVDALSTKVLSRISFIEPEISGIKDEVLKTYQNENKDLKLYTHFFDNLLRKKEHILTPELELILAQALDVAEGPGKIYSMFNNADIQFPTVIDDTGNPIELTKARYMILMESPNRDVRIEAFKALYQTYERFKNTLAALFTSNIKKDIFFMNARQFNSTLETALFSNNIPVEVYTQLIDTVNKHNTLMHRYMSLRKRLLGVEQLHMYDLYTPMIKDANNKISYDEAKETVIKALKPLGEEYIDLLQKGFDNQWIDVYENQGKRSGAYSWGAYGTHPYVLLNHQDNIKSMFTLAHEMGHTLHTYYTNEAQPYIYSDYSIFVAEVASTVNEALLMEYLLKHTEDKNQRLYLLNYFMEQFRTTLYRQTMFAEFELKTHEAVEKGEALTAESLSSLYHDLNVAYYGKEMVIDKELDMEWSRIPHFYTSYYVYQYATGYSAAIALSQKILKEGADAVEKYKGFLKSGNSDYPINVLRDAGVDMATPKPVKSALSVFEKLIDEMENTL